MASSFLGKRKVIQMRPNAVSPSSSTDIFTKYLHRRGEKRLLIPQMIRLLVAQMLDTMLLDTSVFNNGRPFEWIREPEIDGMIGTPVIIWIIGDILHLGISTRVHRVATMFCFRRFTSTSLIVAIWTPSHNALF